LASELAMIVTGLDASENSIAFARTHGANATFVVGDLQRLPFETGSFDGVAGCNSYQFAADPGGAVRDAARVLCSRGRIALAVFDLPEKCDAYRPIRSIYSLLPQSRETLPPFALSGQNALATLIGKNGFAVEKTNAVDAPWTYRDLETALRAFMSAGPSYQAREAAGEERLRVVLEASLSPYRQPDASYRLENVFIVVVAQKMGEMN
jgi:ubiquinone/menaquinone biosynthesis C-methylase UbiE